MGMSPVCLGQALPSHFPSALVHGESSAASVPISLPSSLRLIQFSLGSSDPSSNKMIPSTHTTRSSNSIPSIISLSSYFLGTEIPTPTYTSPHFFSSSSSSMAIPLLLLISLLKGPHPATTHNRVKNQLAFLIPNPANRYVTIFPRALFHSVISVRK